MQSDERLPVFSIWRSLYIFGYARALSVSLSFSPLGLMSCATVCRPPSFNYREYRLYFARVVRDFPNPTLASNPKLVITFRLLRIGHPPILIAVRSPGRSFSGPSSTIIADPGIVIVRSRLTILYKKLPEKSIGSLVSRPGANINL